LSSRLRVGCDAFCSRIDWSGRFLRLAPIISRRSVVELDCGAVGTAARNCNCIGTRQQKVVWTEVSRLDCIDPAPISHRTKPNEAVLKPRSDTDPLEWLCVV
jgi:hypothetical protein